MHAKLEDKCKQLMKNYDRMKPGNGLEYNQLLAAGAAMYVAAGKEVDAERLKECKKLLKSRKGIFSNYRGTAEFIVRCKLALSEDPKSYFERLDRVYREMKTALSSEQDLLAAIVITDFVKAGEESAAVQKTKSIYKEMHKTHPWLTGKEDMPFAALMAITNKDSVSVYEEAENNFTILKENLSATPGTRQMISHVLALYPGHAEIKCDKICRIAKGLKEAKHPLPKDYYMAILGTLAGSSLPAEELVGMIAEADDLLKKHKGFGGIFGIGSSVRRMLAVQMVEAVQEKSSTADETSAGMISSMIGSSIEVSIITLVLMYAVIASSSAA
ncbi:MAG: DUF4003 family protein [Oscillospiraceae bacterium]|nr:DUF4003 family protein [Oscillospiraceae bacterium]